MIQQLQSALDTSFEYMEAIPDAVFDELSAYGRKKYAKDCKYLEDTIYNTRMFMFGKELI